MPLPEEHICEFTTVRDDGEFRTFLESQPSGIAFRTTEYGEHKLPVLGGAAGDFAKWLKSTRPDFEVALPPASDRLVLHSEDIWLPVAFLATDITLPVYLNIVASYLFERMKGMLRGEKPRVHLSVEYRDAKSGKTKRFKYAGDAETLTATIRKIDLNEFFNDERPE